MRQYENAFAAAFELKPGGWKSWMPGPEWLFGLAYLDDQEAVGRQAA